MRIHTIRARRKGKVYKSHLLRQSYCEGGKVKKHTLAGLPALPEPVIELLRRALRGETVDMWKSSGGNFLRSRSAARSR